MGPGSCLHMPFWGFTTLILLPSSTFMMLSNVITEVIVVYNKALLKEKEEKVEIEDASFLEHHCQEKNGSLHQLYKRPIY